MTLQEFFAENPKVALAFSGGVDSSYLLYAATNCRAKVRAYYVKSVFQPRFELDDARRLASELGADMKMLDVDILNDPQITANSADRCYYCKYSIFNSIIRAASEDGFSVLIDGTNASDDAGDRPGMRALGELSVRSPLRECGLTKAEVRRLSKKAGLFTWDKSAYACLATRIPTGVEITQEMLQRTETAEDFLFSQGFADFRVRMIGTAARLQLPEAQLPLLLEKRQAIFSELNPIRAASEDGFSVLIDGTNASDDAGDRPGMRALGELSVRSPLRECGLTKAEVRRLSKKAGLFTWDKSAYACLATRIPTGVEITQEMLQRTETAEDFLFSQGFADFRVRMIGTAARLQLPEAQLPLLLEKRQAIFSELKKSYSAVLLDLEVRE